MLRSKQVGTLSQSARQFFLSGTRCSPADGSSCASSEDETCISKRHLTRNDVQHSQTASTLVPKTSILAGSLISGDSVTAVNSNKTDSADHSFSVHHNISNSASLGKPVCVSYADVSCPVQVDMTHLSAPISDQFVKAGIAAVGFLSDLVNYKIPVSNRNGILGSPQNSMVDPTRPLSNVKTFKNNKARVKPASETVVQSKSPCISLDEKAAGEKSSSCRTINHAVNDRTVNFVGIHGTSLESSGRRRIVSQRPRDDSNHFVDKVRNSGGKLNKTDSLNRLPRGAQIAPIVAPISKQFASFVDVVENVSHILRQLRCGHAAEDALGKLNYPINAYQANQILKHLDNHYVALAFFYWLKQQPGFKHDGHTYTTMVGILGRAKQFGKINKLLEQMFCDGCQPNVVTYNRLIHSYGRANYLKEALDVFNQMQKAGCEPDRVTYCTLIDIHAKSGYLNVAMSMYRRMQEAGLSPDTFTYSVIINCLGKAGHLADAHKLFCEMVKQGCAPNLVTYNIMIALQAKARNYSSALQLYRDMQNAGYEPDKVTYSIVMEVLGHCGYLEEAEALFAEMKQKNWVPDEPVYGLLVDLWGKAGNVEKAWAWYHVMINAGLRPNVPTCNSLLSAFLRVHRLWDALHLLRSMLVFGLNPSLQTYTLLLSCCTEAQTSHDMTFCFQLMKTTAHPAHTFLLSMPTAGPDGQNVRDHMSNFLDVMHSEDRESKRGIVDAVVDFLHKSGLKEEAGSIWEVAAQKNVYPDAVREKSSCYWLINLHVMSEGTAVIALSRTLAWFRRQMLVSGVYPSRIDIVTGWGRRSRVTGTSLVKHAVQQLLGVFNFPFYIENSGCFVGCGEPLNRWLLQSCVERMHLL